MSDYRKNSVTFFEVDENSTGQRVDNFLFRKLKGVPKSHIYRILRSGEVRINKGRIAASYHLQENDIIRIPPITTATSEQTKPTPPGNFTVIYEDEALLVIDKPSGVAVHGGSGISFGVIEQLRIARVDVRYLELAHRLDRETSGLLILAKKRSALVALHEMFRQGIPQKHYYALALGSWQKSDRNVKLPLVHWHNEKGEKCVRVDENGQFAQSIFTIEQLYTNFSLLDVELKTGRTHQIRVHMQHLQHPIAGDTRYGDFSRNRELAKSGLKRMFLHAHSIQIPHPLSSQKMLFKAPLPPELKRFLDKLEPYPATPNLSLTNN